MSKAVNSTGTIIVAAYKQGVDLQIEDAEVLLAYSGVDDRHLLVDMDFNLSIQDCRRGMKHSEVFPVSFRDFLLIAVEINADLIEYYEGETDKTAHNRAMLRGLQRDRKRLKKIAI